jgi:beta-fructofuranosidase
MLECPDLFRWDDRRVLVFSEFSEAHVTRYRTAPTLAGPWLRPDDDGFDGPAFYAAKTASDGRRRVIFGWNTTRAGETDEGAWEWAGRMVVHELASFGAQGIAAAPLPEVEALFSQGPPLLLRPHLGEWEAGGGSFVWTAARSDGYSAATLGPMPDRCLISLSIACERGTRAAGILLRAASDLESTYQLRWEPDRGRVVFDRWPRPGDEPFILERPVRSAATGPLNLKLKLLLKVIVEDSVMVAYFNDAVALSCRGYDHRTGDLGLFVEGGGATFSDVTLRR